jgi:hypothetical protein
MPDKFNIDKINADYSKQLTPVISGTVHNCKQPSWMKSYDPLKRVQNASTRMSFNVTLHVYISCLAFYHTMPGLSVFLPE